MIWCHADGDCQDNKKERQKSDVIWMDAETVLTDRGIGFPEVAFGDRVAGPISAFVK